MDASMPQDFCYLTDFVADALLDIRYVPTEYLNQFVEFGSQDVLFLYSPLVLNNSAMLK